MSHTYGCSTSVHVYSRVLSVDINTMSAPDPCFICSSPGVRTCDQCDLCVRYCDDHERYHHDLVTGQCNPFTVSRMEGVGRVLLATRTIQPGEEIFREEEMVVGPNR